MGLPAPRSSAGDVTRRTLPASYHVPTRARGETGERAGTREVSETTATTAADLTDPAYAASLDEADPLAHLRDRFAIPDPDLVYLDGNSLGRLPLATRARLGQVIDEEWGRGLVRSWDQWIGLPQRVGDLMAEHLLGARPGRWPCPTAPPSTCTSWRWRPWMPAPRGAPSSPTTTTSPRTATSCRG